ncbi:MAG: 1-deoxy-D-xylulose-5-phosphate reductoisomerase [Oscillospiraceae bacterium]|nr:1-deoxy-D-xylulose-5-phosphate reductoisomerase [Oscillospiraceae bacterium]
MVEKLCVLGSTGSIGTQALSLVEALGIKISTLAANRSARLLAEQCERFRPENVCAADEAAARELKTLTAHLPVKVFSGAEALCELAAEDGSDTVLTALVGAAGLEPTLAAIDSGKDIALANKETLVAGGALVTRRASERGVSLLPVDSEHSAIFQCLQDAASARTLKRIILTASGGPFFGKSAAELEGVTVDDALRHPNWSMGRKITVDSATLMNKGLELIEAMWLFSLEPEDIEITVHRQSIVHSAVEFADGAVIAQLGVPDMKLPIQYALTYPERKPCPADRLTIEKMSLLTFERPDEETFRALAACKLAAKLKGLAPCVANAANEEAVAAFLEQRIGFLDIGRAVEASLEGAPAKEDYTLSELLEADREARAKTREYLKRLERPVSV